MPKRRNADHGEIAARGRFGGPGSTKPKPPASGGRDPKGGIIAGKEEKIEMEGEIIEALRNRMFRVRLDNGHETLGYTAGKMRRYRIRMLLGDRVKIELSPYDLDRGRIVYRYR